MKNLTISSLAILKSNYDVGRHDFIDNLRPFATFAIATIGKAPFNELRLKEVIAEEFGLSIPQRPLALLLKRLTKEGTLVKKDRLFRNVSLPDNRRELQSKRAEYLREGNALLGKLREFVARKFRLEWSDNDAEGALFGYLATYSIDCITAFEAGEVFPIVGESPRNSEFLISSFIQDISKSSPTDFAYLITLVKGKMLASALLGEDLAEVQMTLKKVTIYLDAPLIFDLLGVNGTQSKALVDETLELVHGAKGRLAVYGHTFDEVEMILRIAEKNLELPSEARGKTFTQLAEIGATASDIALLRSQLRKILQEHDIKVLPSREYRPEFQIDERELESEFEKAGLFHKSEGSRRADINSIRCIFDEREESGPRRLEDCRAVLLTSNLSLAREAYIFGKARKVCHEVSVAITDYSLTNLLWLKSPLKKPDLAEKIVAANCYGALKPSAQLWDAYLRELKKLKENGRIDAQSHQFLRYDLKAQEDLMNLTCGNESNLSEQVLSRIVESVEARIRQPLLDKLAERKRDHEASQKLLDQSMRTLDSHQEREERLRGKAKNIGRFVERGAMVAFAPLLVGVVVIGRWPFDPNFFAWIPQWVRVALVAIVLVLTLISQFSSWKAWRPFRWIAARAGWLTYKLFCKHYEIAPGDVESYAMGAPGLRFVPLSERIVAGDDIGDANENRAPA